MYRTWFLDLVQMEVTLPTYMSFRTENTSFRCETAELRHTCFAMDRQLRGLADVFDLTWAEHNVTPGHFDSTC